MRILFIIFFFLTFRAGASQYKVGNFKTDTSSKSADTTHLYGGWGDTLKTAVSHLDVVAVLAPIPLNSGNGVNGAAGANPIVSASGSRTFSIAYVAWDAAHNKENIAVSTYVYAPADIIMRGLTISGPTGSLANGTVIAGAENTLDGTCSFYGGCTGRTPPPGYLSFAAEGSSYAAYWTTLRTQGSLRRTTDEDKGSLVNPDNFGTYVEPSSKVVLSYYGHVSMAPVPGSGVNKLIVAYMNTSGPASAVIRWEDMDASTSIPVTLSRAPVVLMEDFAVAVDAAGTALIMWREYDQLWGAAYNLSRTQIMAPKQLAPGPIDTVNYPKHTYRKYGAASVGVNQFVITYGRGAVVYYRPLPLTTGTPGAEVQLTPSGKTCVFPNVTASSAFVLFAWYGDALQTARQVEGAFFQQAGGVISSASRKDIELGGEDVAFDAGITWELYHNYHVPSIAVNDFGDIAVAWDNGFGARVSAWSNLPIYYDTSSFTSRAIAFRNPQTGDTLNPLIDSVEVLEAVWLPGGNVSMQIALAQSSAFDQPADTFFPLANGVQSIKSDASYFKYQLILDSKSSSNKISPIVDSVSISFNAKPQRVVVDSALTAGGTVLHTAPTTYDLYTRRDSMGFSALVYDMDNAGAYTFNISLAGVPVTADTTMALGGGQYRVYFSLPAKDTVGQGIPVTITFQDSLGWASEPDTILVNYLNDAPVITMSMGLLGMAGASLAPGDTFTMPARDTASLIVRVSDSNDDSVRVTITAVGGTLADTVLASGDSVQVMANSTLKLMDAPFIVSVSDPDTAVTASFKVNYTNDAPIITMSMGLLGKARAPLVPGDTFSLPARDTAFLMVMVSDSNNDSLRVNITAAGAVVADTMLASGDSAQIMAHSALKLMDEPYIISVGDPDTVVTASFKVNHFNEAPRFTASLVRALGAESAGGFDPNAGDKDTIGLLPDTNLTLFLNTGNSLIFSGQDSLDDSLNLEIFHKSQKLLDTTLAHDQVLVYALSITDNASQQDVVLRLSDPDTTVSVRFYLEPEEYPVLFRMFTVFQGDTIGMLADTGTRQINSVPLRSSTWRVFYGDPDSAFGDTVKVQWTFLQRPAACAKGNYSCYLVDSQYTGDSISHLAQINTEAVIVKLEDILGAFLADTIALIFPHTPTPFVVGDTVGVNSPAALVLQSAQSFRSDTLIFTNLGTSVWRIDSVRTGHNDEEWLAIEYFWSSPGSGLSRRVVNSSTDIKIGPLEVIAGSAPLNQMQLVFQFFTENLRGDSALTDTLFIWTNDLLNPMIKIPLQLHYFDLPYVTISTQKSTVPLPKSTALHDTLGNAVSRQTTLVFAFSEPVLAGTADSGAIHIYSYLDSLVLGYMKPIPSAQSSGYFETVYHQQPYGVVDNSLIDTLKFTPSYLTAGDSLKVRPPSGSFIQGDIIHVHINNSITDSAGHALDLSLLKVAENAGTRDSVFTLAIDNSSLQVVSTFPVFGSSNFDPSRPVSIRFNRPLLYEYVHPVTGQPVISVDTVNLVGNQTLSVVSAYNGMNEFRLSYIRLTDGDSTLIFQTTPQFYSIDTVFIKVFSKLAGYGLVTLDGNSNGIQGYYYDQADTTDFYQLNFFVSRKEFYVYPNPFRWSNQQHSQKGAMTFKNLSSLKGAQVGASLDFRIYSSSGDLVYSSQRQGEGLILQDNQAPVWEWDLRNNHDIKVGTGVYIFSVYVQGKLAKKGKIAVIR